MSASLRRLPFWIFCLLLASCGGGGGGGSSGPEPPTWTIGTFPPASTFEAKCASPRTGTDPTTGRPFPDVLGTRTDENMWLRSWTNDLYLWYSEVPDVNPSPYTTLDYFDLLKTSATTSSGNPKDKFHFTLSTSEWVALSQSGAEAGYGAQWVLLSATPPRHVVVAFTDPGTPAAPTGMSPLLSRGTDVITVDGVDVANGSDVDTLNSGLFPSAAGQMHTFTVRDLGSSMTRTVTMTSAIVTTTPVQNVSVITPLIGGPVGYMLFNDHIATAENLLIDAINTLRNAAVTDLVLDIRYNGGGFLDIASELAFMIAGPGQTTGQTFELVQFNNKHPTRDPVTGELIAPIPFHSQTVGFGGPAGQPLPSLNLSRVFVLTGNGTCSASESIINSLRGVNVQVIQIGSTTCGKPYGFYPQDNCGTTYFSIEFKGVNAKAFGDYTDGFSPQNTTPAQGEPIPGCSVADDFSHALGDPDEGRFKVALDYRQNPVCSVPPSGIGPHALAVQVPESDGVLVKSPWRENRILRR